MNSQGWARGMMSKSYETKDFLAHVVKTIHRQLLLWNENYQVELLQNVLSEEHYTIVVTLGGNSYKVALTLPEAKRLQHTSPFTLDRYLWRKLQAQGLDIQESTGNYLTYCAI